jgi:hypothetical protein
MICEYCGVKTIKPTTCQDIYNQLAFYTLNEADPVFFIHQLIVDAYAGQHAKTTDKPIKIAFALIGLYLFSEKGYTGKEVQNAHMQLANMERGNFWPSFKKPHGKASMNVGDVLSVKAGKNRDEAIKKWATSVWLLYSEARPDVINLLSEVKFKY